MTEVGLFFGSFNPIHTGHMIIAQTMFEYSSIEELWFIVSPQNPFKKTKSLLHEFDRYDMVEVAIRENPKFKVSDIEFNMPKPSYTIDTLTLLSEKHPDKKFRLIMGGDNMKNFHKWKNSEMILKNYGLLVYPRPNQDKASLVKHSNIEYIESPMLDISATFIRNAIKKGHSIKYLVPESVESYIDRKGLYR
ncbi:nicotinate (nicotinamide) nucleotide adenylyltransferase [Reichenbachiella sp. MALMAid0571]|uniref:nicotinate (nicotinamide) nucleotide adenylyltransferase n=1 Tax=Reichenbachiella sp. MALMAid0571 TaxID=3143939 RepID=UPI0032DF561F